MEHAWRRSRSSAAAALLVVVAMLLSTGCDWDDVVAVRLGSLEIRTQTSGSNVDPDGYQVRVFGSGFDTTRTIGVDDAIVLSLVSDRSYTATLSDIASNCLADVNPKTVTVPLNSIVSAIFNVACS